jgi:hypothetical protein
MNKAEEHETSSAFVSRIAETVALTSVVTERRSRQTQDLRDSIHMLAAWVAGLLGVVFSYAAGKRVLLIALGYCLFFLPAKNC